MTSFIVRIAEEAEQEIVNAAKTVVNYIDNVIVNDIEPELANFFAVIVPAEVAALKPYALQALNTIIKDIPALLSGNIKQFWTDISPVLIETAETAGAAGLTTAEPIVMASVSAVIADIKANKGQ